MDHLKFSQRGVTLIEILIALALSIIIILAMLRAFVTTGKVTAEASIGAKADSSMMLGLIAADRILQSIGFGEIPTYGNTLKAYKVDGADALNSTDSAEYLVWEIDTNHCQALRNDSSGLLIYGKSAGYGCTNLSKPDVDKDPVERLIQIDDAVVNIQPELNSEVEEDKKNKIGTIHIAVKKKECWPFGIKSNGIKPGQYQVEISANTYAASTESAARTIQNSTCLFNFK